MELQLPSSKPRSSLVRQFNIKGISELQFRKVIAGASAAYMVHKRVPSVEEIHFFSGSSRKSISMVLSTPEFKEVMNQRGYNWDKAKLSPEQEFAVGIITDPSRRGDLSSKLKAAGISYRQYNGWMKEPHFKDFISKVGEDMLGENIVNVHTSVLNKATAGDINAAKLVYELTGRHDPARQASMDLQNIINLLLEVITRHVRDVNVLDLISKDVELVMSGKTPDALSSFTFAEDTLEVVDAEVVGYDTTAPVGNDSDVAVGDDSIAKMPVTPVGKKVNFFDFDGN